MRNYDEMANGGEDRTFLIRGETFKLKQVGPGVLDEMTALEEEFVKLDTPKYSDISNLAEQKLVLLLDPADDALARWQALRAEDKVGYKEIVDLSRWAFEVVTGFPTRLLEASQAGAGSTAASSTAG